MNTLLVVLGMSILLVLPAAARAQDEGAETMDLPQIAAGSGEHPIGGVELFFTAAAATQEFYRTVFGWTSVPFEDDYFFFEAPAGLGGGFRGKPPAEQLNGLIYIYTPDVAAKLEEIEAAGGSRAGEKEVVDPESGQGYAYFRDPAGVLMVVCDLPMQQDYAPQPLAGTEGLIPGSIVSVELYGGDLEQTGKFYRDVFGWRTQEMMPQFLLFNTGQGIGGVFQSHTPSIPVMLYIWVEDVAAALTQIEAAGGKREGEPMAMPGMPTFGYFVDPAGKSIGLMGPGA